MSSIYDEMMPKLGIRAETMDEMQARGKQYLFYETDPRDRRQKLCKCTACGNAGVFEIPGAAHKAGVICPMCMEPVVMIAHGKLKDNAPSLEECEPVVWFKELDGDLWAVNAMAIRWFQRESWDGPDWDFGIRFEVFSLYRFRPGKGEEWRHHWYFGWPTTPQRPTEPRITGMWRT